jgi:hypothetical protein
MGYTFGERLGFETDMIQWNKNKMKYKCYCCNKLIVKVYEHMQLQTHIDNLEILKNEID